MAHAHDTDSDPSHDSHDEDAHVGHDHSQGVTWMQVVWVVISGLCLVAGFALEAAWQTRTATWAFALSTLAGAVLVAPHAWESAKARRLDINVLMMVAVIGAWIIQEGKEGAAVVFLFSLAELLESWSVGRARRAIQSLMALTPDTARVKLSDGTIAEIEVEDVQLGQIVLVRSGERVPLDGKISKGNSSLDQSPITGESVPVDKAIGDALYAGSINGEGSLEVEVTKVAGDSTLSRILQLVAEAEEQKAPTQRFVDKFASYYTPMVFAIALAVALIPPLFMNGDWSVWFYRSLVLLVIACPCALVIATPVSIVSGLTALAKRGVLIKGGAYLEAVGKLRALAVDKTGTITRGKPTVLEVLSWNGTSEEEILRKAAAIDSHSTHPLAQAVARAASERGLKFAESSDYQARTGRGAEAVIEGHPHFIGNHRMAHDLGVCSPELEARLAEIEARGLSLAVLGHTPHADCEGKVLGILVIGDQLREEVHEALQMLHAAGVEKIVMLSGDNQRTASAIAKQAGIDEAKGDLLPEQKVEQVRELVKRYEHVGMVGDGINDAPALAVASVGIAMGAVGSDAAIETADMALMNDDLRRLAEAVGVGKRALSIIRANVTFAIVVKLVFLILALLGQTTLWMAILADTGATLLVIANAMRLLRIPSAS